MCEAGADDLTRSLNVAIVVTMLSACRRTANAPRKLTAVRVRHAEAVLISEVSIRHRSGI